MDSSVKKAVRELYTWTEFEAGRTAVREPNPLELSAFSNLDASVQNSLPAKTMTKAMANVAATSSQAKASTPSTTSNSKPDPKIVPAPLVPGSAKAKSMNTAPLSSTKQGKIDAKLSAKLIQMRNQIPLSHRIIRQ